MSEEMASNDNRQTGASTAPEKLAPEDAARRLHSLSGRAESFIVTQWELIGETLEQCQAALQQGETHRAKLSELEQQKSKWSDQKATEVAQLQAIQDQLASAWEELEANQRKLAIEQEELKRQIAQPREPSQENSRLPQGDVPMQISDVVPADAVLEQYQQLKREVRLHAKRSRGK